MARKYEAIDLMKLHAHGSHVGWNKNLKDCFEKRDINRLGILRYRICAGMTDLEKLKLNDAKMNEWFLRLNTSIEKTVSQILRLKYPLPEQKTQRQSEFERFMKQSAF